MALTIPVPRPSLGSRVPTTRLPQLHLKAVAPALSTYGTTGVMEVRSPTMLLQPLTPLTPLNSPLRYFLTMNAGTGGTVLPASGWKNSGSTGQIKATANSGFTFSNWTGSGSGSFSGTTNPATITINGPITETATFSSSSTPTPTPTVTPTPTPTATPTPTPTATPTPTPTPTATPTPTPGNIQVVVQTSVAGPTFTVDGTNYSSTQTFSWVSGSNHTIGTTSPQSGGTGTQYVWNSWSDGGAISHNVAPTTNTTYTAKFTTQYFLTMNAGTGGTVTPASGWKNSGSTGQIKATANSGFTFSNWTGSGSGSFSGTTNPATITINGPITETAAFTQNP